MSEAELLAATGITPRQLVRLRQQGIIQPVEPRQGLGRGRGTTRLEYPLIAVATIKRYDELSQIYKDIGERRWRLWLEGYPVRIAPDLANTLRRLSVITGEIKTLNDIETKIPTSLWHPAKMPRGHPLRVIFHGLSDEDLRSLTTMVICFVLGIRLPLFDEPNPAPFRIFKRAFGLPKEWEMPPGLFDVFPYVQEQVINALAKATASELKGARTVCLFLSRLLDKPENWRRGAIVVGGAPLPWRPIKLASLLWPSPVARAVTVGLIVFGIRAFRSALGEAGLAAFASVANEMGILWPRSV